MDERSGRALSDLLAALPQVLTVNGPADNRAITQVTADSRQVLPDGLFVAIPGETTDGHRFIGQVADRGAAAVVGSRPSERLPDGLTYIQVPDSREALGWLAAAWYGFPSRQITTIGVTGTDGKTTTTNLIYSILTAAGYPAGMISTVNAQIGDQAFDTGLHTTTPDALDLQHYLAEMVASGSRYAVLETTSHGLAQHRVTGVDYDVAVLTNITHEHLDYHGTFEAYRAAKGKLFARLGTSYRKPGVPKVAIWNSDDSSAVHISRISTADRALTYSLRPGQGEITAGPVTARPGVMSFSVHSPQAVIEMETSLVGLFNVSNILAAVAAGVALSVPIEAIRDGVAALRTIPGRMERIDEGQSFTVIVDFAHTPNALQRALETVRALTKGRVIAVYGAAGLRDREKRPMMGAIGTRLADLVIITAEDPRTEDVQAIMDQMAAGAEVEGRHNYRQMADRGQAIRFAISHAWSGDVVIICGKGHEQSMCFGSTEYPWDDRQVARQALRSLSRRNRT